MNSRDRVLAAVTREGGDRVPMDFSANAGTLARLMRDLGVPTHRALLERLHVDILDLRGVVDPVYRGPLPQSTQLPGGVRQNVWGMRTRVMQTLSGPEECYCDFVLGSCENVDDLARHAWPSPDWFDFTGLAERLQEWDDLALMASGASLWQHATFLRGMDQLLMDMAAEPAMAQYLMNRFADFNLEYFDRMLTAACGRIDILRIADDVGMQDRLMVSPQAFDTFLAHNLRRFVDMAHSHGARVMFHSCGSIVPLIDRLIELGVDILDPVQVSATGMDPSMLKQRFGGRICLHGSIDTQYLLPRGSAADVEAEVRRMVSILGCRGGFILAPCHVLQTDVPTPNVLALYDTGRQALC